MKECDVENCPKIAIPENHNAFQCVNKEMGWSTILLMVSFTVWVINSIFDLRASMSDTVDMKSDIKIIKTCLINGICKEH